MFTMYEAGESVFRGIIGKEVLEKTYVCVIENAQEKTMEEARTLLKYELQEANLNPTIFQDTGFIAKTGDIYEVANELVYESEAFRRQPSNILRHVFSVPLTIHGLYKDEQDEVIDLTQKGIDHIVGMKLFSVIKEYKKYFAKNPDALLPVLKLYFDGWGILGYFSDYLCTFDSNALLQNKQQLLDIINDNVYYNMGKLNNYKGLDNWLKKQGFQYLAVFGDPPVVKEPPPQDLKFVLKEIEEEDQEE